MKKVWIFLLIAVVLIAWTLVRERFEATPSIQAPPYDKADKIRIFGLLSTPDQAFLMTNMKAQDPTNGAVFDALSVKTGLSNEEKAKLQQAKEALEEKAGGLLTPSIEKFYNDVFKPATVPITPQNIDTFLTSDTNTLVTKDMLKRVLTTYFISQGGVSGNSAYASVLAGLGQGQGYLNSGPSGAAGAAAGGAGGATGATGAAGGGASGAGGAGGSSGAAGGSGGAGGQLNKLFGPLFTGFGNPGAQGLVDSSKTNPYPELLGGRGKKWGSAAAAGGGAAGGGLGGLGGGLGGVGADLKGSLPSSAGLGSDENSKYLPYSRQPGDMDLVQDPYRVSQQFASSSYSFKTEPVPFLTDFSAFQN
jgi:hypothetical protein